MLVSLVLLGLVPLLAAQAGPAPHFTDVARRSGLVFRHDFGAKRLQNVLMTTGSGCALFDYDNDGWLDAFLVNSTPLDREGRVISEGAKPHALFHNKGDGTFENVTQAAGLDSPSYGQGIACGDFDADGWVDLYLTNYGPNRLYRNRGDGTFEDVTERSGTGDPRWGGGALFFDYDGDRDLDLFVANYLKFEPDMAGVHSSSLSKKIGFISFPGPRDYEAEEDVLYRNNGDGTFTDVSKAAGLISGGKSLAAIACDLDGDGDQDLFVANDATPNFLYRNDGGRFSEIALESGVAYDPDGVETAAMGVDVADVDENGRPDLYVTNMVFEFNNMYVNQGGLLFEDRTRAMGLDKDNYRHVGWATRFADFNHDGLLDCFVANGHVVDYVEGFSQSITYKQQNMLFLGQGKGRFKNVANDCGKHLRRKRVTRGAAFGDYDNDGDIDILLANSGGRAELLRNELPPNERWLELRLRGEAPNTYAIGAKVTLRLGKRTLTREVRFSPSYLSSSDPTLHFGLEPGQSHAVVEIAWPSGKKTKHAVKAGSLTVIEE
ncbi:MAG: CRTAC1 family protein [Planctomycetota bacterium]